MPDDAQDKKWEMEDDARTLIRAAKIRNEPKRYKRAKAELARQAAAAKRAALEHNVGVKMKKTFSSD